MTSDIKIGPFKPVKPAYLSWKNSVDNFSNTAVVKLPSIAFLKCNDNNTYEKVDTALLITEGMKIEAYCGYNGDNRLRHKGFIRRINYTTPVEFECEGYSYQLRQKKRITKVYPKGTALKTILNELIDGTDIRLYDGNPSINIECAVPFRNVDGIQVLEWIKEKLLQTVYFKNEVLYVGLRETQNPVVVKFSLGWNVIKDNKLKFSNKREYATVNISLAARNKNGTFRSTATRIKDGATKYKRLTVAIDQETIDRTAKQEQEQIANLGYEGGITAFLVPFVEIGMAADIEDRRYPDRIGKHFIPSEEGEFSTSGGRVNIKIGNTLGN